MASIWITYAWVDNKHGDVDFVAQELQRAGLTVKLDRWNISAGQRLWDQIGSFIVDPTQSDAWVLVATQNSLQSEPCKEEFAYALHRALKTRGEGYPVIALFLGQVDKGRMHKVMADAVQPYHMRVHSIDGRYAIEVRPRAGVWAPFMAGIPANEKQTVSPSIISGPRDVPTSTGMLVNAGEGLSNDGSYWIMFAGNQATPTESYYIWCQKLPTKLLFGVKNGQPQFLISIPS